MDKKLKINLSKEKLQLFYLTMILSNEILKNEENIINNSAKRFRKRVNEFVGINESHILSDKIYEIARISVENTIATSIITNMFHTFEQYIKLEYNITAKGKESVIEKLEGVCHKFNYNVKESEYYETVEKYRKLNNSIKHGKINKDLKKQYPELINDEDDWGTLLNNTFNITEDITSECCSGLCKFVGEMYNYFEDMGYLE